MCGIAGVISANPGLHDYLFDMTDVQKHRGPDGQGHVFISDSKYNEFKTKNSYTNELSHVGLGHRRLAIIAPEPSGDQPLQIDIGQYWIVFNGEIYNYLELRKELGELGHVFRTKTDTEVILVAYKQWGCGCFSRFNGMWSLAIWDGQKNCLILSRDRLGVKPLHFYQSGGELVFSSEIKGILASKKIEVPKLNSRMAIDFLKWRQLNHTSETFFKDIFSFPAGHYAVITTSTTESFTFEKYWSLSVESPSASPEAHELFKALLDDSVKLRMRSDVPIGACLSGGLDSSSIVALASAGSSAAIKTFTARSDSIDVDEGYWANIVNQEFGACPHSITPNEYEFVSQIEKIIWHQEEPFNTSSIYAQWELMKLARGSGVPVLLDGQGADEILCGYRKYYFFYLKQLFRQKRYAKLLSESVSLYRYGDKGFFNWKLGRRYLPKVFRSRSKVSLNNFLTDQYLKVWDESEIGLSAGDVKERQRKDVVSYSVPALLRYEDRNSMAWSVEARVPFLDYRLVEKMVGLEVDEKLNGGRTKAVLRSGLKGLVPDEILNRRDKMGFSTEQDKWLEGELGDKVFSYLSKKNSKLVKLLDIDAFVSANYLASTDKLSPEGYDDAFRLYILGLWMDVYNVEP